MKKLLSAVLVLSMLLTLVVVTGVSVSATSVDVGTEATYTDGDGVVWTVIRTEHDLPFERTAGGRYIMANDIEITMADLDQNKPIKMGADAIFDGNGYTITFKEGIQVARDGIFSLHDNVTFRNVTFGSATNRMQLLGCLMVRAWLLSST